jgi:hypothetical protein
MSCIERRAFLSFGYGGDHRAIRLVSGAVWGLFGLSCLVTILWKAHLIRFVSARRPGRDRRDAVMASAQKVWKEVGGTAQGWNDWAVGSSLAAFNSGAGGSQAWAKLAESSPDLVFTDALGNRWNPRDLAKRTTFITMWASWCSPVVLNYPIWKNSTDTFATATT